MKAIGSVAKLAGITRIVAKGTWQGYEDTERHPLQVYARAPGRRTTIVDNQTAAPPNR